MQPKVILMRYLLIGISLALFPQISGCGQEEDPYYVTVDFVFENESSHQLTYSALFNLDASEEERINTGSETDEKNPDPEDCCQGLLEDFQGAYDQVYIVFDETQCLYFDEGQGPTDLGNFEVVELAKRHFQYTYTFSDTDYQESQPCD